jgi:PilZ domain
VRVPIQAHVTCVVESRALRGVTRNISERGIEVELPELRKRANVRLEFRLPGSDSMIDATGAVIWVLGKRNGIKFKFVGEQSQKSLRQFIQKRKQSAS